MEWLKNLFGDRKEDLTQKGQIEKAIDPESIIKTPGKINRLSSSLII